MAGKLTVGLAAHVDAGKTTLSEAMLFLSGAVRRQGRVDHGDAFLDTEQMEKERGITIFSKEARLTWGKTDLTLQRDGCRGAGNQRHGGRPVPYQDPVETAGAQRNPGGAVCQ